MSKNFNICVRQPSLNNLKYYIPSFPKISSVIIITASFLYPFSELFGTYMKLILSIFISTKYVIHNWVWYFIKICSALQIYNIHSGFGDGMDNLPFNGTVAWRFRDSNINDVAAEQEDSPLQSNKSSTFNLTSCF